MTSTTAAPAETAPGEPPSRGPRLRMRHRAGLVLLLAAVGAALVCWWLVTGLLDASRTIQAKAAVAQSELQAFQVSIKAGDKIGAATHLAAGRRELAAADSAAGGASVRLARFIPWVGATVTDLNHLLAAADIIAASGSNALRLYDDFSGAHSQLFTGTTFNLSAIRRAQRSVAGMAESMKDAQGELDQVTGAGPRGGEALQKKKTALAQVTSVSTQIAALAPVLRSLPEALGAKTPKVYLLAIMNPAELRASGGAPLSVAFLSFDHGAMTIAKKGTTSDLTIGNTKRQFTKSPGDPWQNAGPQRFVNLNFNPNFLVSAQQMILASPINFGYEVDGVVALDIVAVSDLLRVTGPIPSAGAGGEITADNVAKRLLVNAYRHQQSNNTKDITRRHDVNERLLAIMLERLTTGGALVSKVRALGDAVPGRHLQMYFRNADLERLMVDKGMAGAVPTPTVGDLNAVYTQNTNGSKLDVFQQRDVTDKVQLRADGSAEVTRTVRITNDSPPYVAHGPDQRFGYDTRWAGNLLINLIPGDAVLTRSPTVHTTKAGVQVSSIQSGNDNWGRRFVQARVMLPPQTTGTVSWTYVINKAADRQGKGLRFLSFVTPQATLNVTHLDLQVTVPAGWTTPGGPGWTVVDRTATTDVDVDRPYTLELAVNPG